MTDISHLSPQSRVWIYQSNVPFQSDLQAEIDQQIRSFTDQWVSHNRQLFAYGGLFHQRFIVLMVDETQAGASGCSIDSSVRFIQHLEQTYGVDLFDRLRFSYQTDQGIETVTKGEFAKRYADGLINDHTLVFDTLVSTKQGFEEQFLKPLGESWHKRMV